jgi:hypothetical protein
MDNVHCNPEGYQIRHSVLGIFQGIIQGAQLWHPMSCVPELSIFRFQSFDEARLWILKISDMLDNVEGELSIEVFDRNLALKLEHDCISIHQALRLIPAGSA